MENKKRLNVAIDGPVGAGKSSVADAAAKRLGILHLDTGAMYRALGYTALQENIDVQDEAAVVALCGRIRLDVSHQADGQHTFAEGEDVTGKIRTPEVSMAASTVSRYAEVRRAMVRQQQRLAAETDMLLDGRDICTTVLPNATAKIYLTASPEVRARRRWLEMQEKGMNESYEKVLEDVIRRDEQDMNRAVEPLRQAEDAVLVDSSGLTFDETVDRILAIVEAKTHE
ncbi:MAG: (d)CMP kinase [Clostridia bacterium]|nr:(d)CMP kinase [Clostridia bacterium]